MSDLKKDFKKYDVKQQLKILFWLLLAMSTVQWHLLPGKKKEKECAQDSF